MAPRPFPPNGYSGRTWSRWTEDRKRMSPDRNETEGTKVDPVRTRMMRTVRRADTQPEMAVRRTLFAAGYRYRVNVRRLPGTPDVVLPGRRLAIFVHGCFWHRHVGCRFATAPRTRAQFWQDKFARNVARDAAKRCQLEAAGWRVVEIWECEVKDGSFEGPILELVGSIAPVNRRRP
ncbi:very short patch repair endonuclease [Mesorhizobium sp. M0085]|uniref:very short patch repair endonuclease n=1 Tax=Mesorhizobium sp. M0085 TaxID=2956872 RepID=UPI00333B772D